jgi:hypothetical protein
MAERSLPGAQFGTTTVSGSLCNHLAKNSFEISIARNLVSFNHRVPGINKGKPLILPDTNGDDHPLHASHRQIRRTNG